MSVPVNPHFSDIQEIPNSDFWLELQGQISAHHLAEPLGLLAWYFEEEKEQLTPNQRLAAQKLYTLAFHLWKQEM